MIWNDRLLDAVFGPTSRGDTPEARAETSTRLFVRSLQQLAEDSPEAKGRRLTASEALDAYGPDALAEIASEGSAVIGGGVRSASKAIKQRVSDLGISNKDIANLTGLQVPIVDDVLGGRPGTPIRVVERVAGAVGLDDRMIGIRDEPTGNEAVAVRLRAIGDEQPRMTRPVVAAIAEAAWVASTQARLERSLAIGGSHARLVRSHNYGGPGNPTYRQGYVLAAIARSHIGNADGPILSLRELCEETLGIPLIQANLGDQIAGVTVEVDNARAIVLNSGGAFSVLVRRVTIAHELGHLLFDPVERLGVLRVDSLDEVERSAGQLSDPVEQRANAFAVELLAPQQAALTRFQEAQGTHVERLADVALHFGLSSTPAKYQVYNGSNRSISVEGLHVPARLLAERAQEWVAREEYTVGYHPIQGLSMSRCGRFSAVVVRAAEEGRISWDTAASYLKVDQPTLKAVRTEIRDLFPSVFQSAQR